MTVIKTKSSIPIPIFANTRYHQYQYCQYQYLSVLQYESIPIPPIPINSFNTNAQAHWYWYMPNVNHAQITHRARRKDHYAKCTWPLPASDFCQSDSLIKHIDAITVLDGELRIMALFYLHMTTFLCACVRTR